MLACQQPACQQWRGSGSGPGPSHCCHPRRCRLQLCRLWPCWLQHAGMCMQMHVYMCVYMEYYGVLKGTMGFSPNFDFLCSFGVLVQKPSRMVWERPRSLSKKQMSLLLYICPYLFYMFITIAYWTHGLVLLWRQAQNRNHLIYIYTYACLYMLDVIQVEVCIRVIGYWTVFG